MPCGREPAAHSTTSHQAVPNACCLPSLTISTRSGMIPFRATYTTRLVTGSTSSLHFLCSNRGSTPMDTSTGDPGLEREAHADRGARSGNRARRMADVTGKRQHPPRPWRDRVKHIARSVEKQKLARPICLPHRIQVDEHSVVVRLL